jgi:hypothetical protein
LEHLADSDSYEVDQDDLQEDIDRQEKTDIDNGNDLEKLVDHPNQANKVVKTARDGESIKNFFRREAKALKRAGQKTPSMKKVLKREVMEQTAEPAVKEVVPLSDMSKALLATHKTVAKRSTKSAATVKHKEHVFHDAVSEYWAKKKSAQHTAPKTKTSLVDRMIKRLGDAVQSDSA